MAVQERKLQSRLFASLNRSDELVNFLLEKVGESSHSTIMLMTTTR